MKKKIAILGSTGSIGKNTIQIIEKDKQNFEIELLSTNKNIIKIYNQAKKFKVKNIIIHDKEAFVNQHNMEVGLDAEQEYLKNKAEVENSLKRTPGRLGDQKAGDTSFVNPIKGDIIDGITKALQQMKTNN